MAEIDIDDNLVLECQRGNARAFASLYSRHSRLLESYLFSLLGKREGLEDLHQEVFLRVLRSIPAYQPKNRFPVFLLTIAKRLVFEEWKKSGREKRGAEVVAERQMKSAKPEEWEKNDLDAALLKLTAEERELLCLRYEENMTLEDLGGMLNLHPSSIAKRCDAILEKLRFNLKGNRES